jgi:hypothetical protein
MNDEEDNESVSRFMNLLMNDESRSNLIGNISLVQKWLELL